jgi:hypothetical protein
MAMSGRGDTDLYPELVWPMRLALADALHFRRVQGIDLGSALTHLRQRDLLNN